MLQRRETWEREPGFDIGTFRKTTKSKNPSIVRGIQYHNSVYKVLRVWQKLSAPDHELIIEPWLRASPTRRMLQPDFVLIHPETNTGVAGEVKLNWKDGRDEKLINEYLWAVESAYGLAMVWPALVTRNVAHLNRQPRVGAGALLTVDDWNPGDPTPVILLP